MNGIARATDGIIVTIAPQFALKRTAARHKMQVLNSGYGNCRVTPGQFNKELAALGEDVPEIIVRINSPSSDVFAANAIYTRLKDHLANITVKIDGWAASAAMIIAMVGDTIKIICSIFIYVAC